MARTLPAECRPRKRCHDWRNCPACAAIRQARIADTAEGLLAGYLQLQLIVLKPESTAPKHMQAAIRAAIRNNGLRAGIWTIERGQKAGTLHANLLTHAAPLKPHRSAAQHAETVRTNARIVAAYIAKREQAPRADHYPGKTYGAWGKLADYLLDQRQAPILTAAAVEFDLAAERQPQPGQTLPPILPRGPELSTDDYRAIAARHLPTLAAISDSFKRRKKEAESTCLNGAADVQF